MDTNAAGSSAAGSTDEKIASVGVWRDSDLFGAAEKAAFAFAEGMTATPADVTDKVYADAAKHFSEAQLVELAATAAMENYRARLNRAFLVEAQGFYRPGAEARGG